MSFGIHSIFKSTEGEGVWVGTPQVFVRFQGCNIGCVNCDSKETWDFEKSQNLSLDNVLEQIQTLSENKIKRVAITGGDPLHPKHEKNVELLVKTLKAKGFYITIEASGTRVVDSIFDNIDYINFDIKTPSTMVKFNLRPIQKLIDQYSNKSQIKAVIQNKEDFEMVSNLYNSIDNNNKTDMPWVLTPCYEVGDKDPVGRMKTIMAWNQESAIPFRVILQQHKILFGPQKKNV